MDSDVLCDTVVYTVSQKNCAIRYVYVWYVM